MTTITFFMDFHSLPGLGFLSREPRFDESRALQAPRPPGERASLPPCSTPSTDCTGGTPSPDWSAHWSRPDSTARYDRLRAPSSRRNRRRHVRRAPTRCCARCASRRPAAAVGAPNRVMEYPERALDAGLANATSFRLLWEPLNGAVFKTERFKAFVRNVGFVDSWRMKGWPDHCRPVGADDFVCVDRVARCVVPDVLNWRSFAAS